MKKIILSVFVFAFFSAAYAQIENPVTWTYSAKKIKGDLYELHMTALLEGKWHIYSQNAGEGPVPTSFSFDRNPLVKPEGAITEAGKLEKEYDPNFKSTLQFYTGKVDFVQKIHLKSAVNTVAKGKVTFMVCNDKKCLPPRDVDFSIKISPKS